jgi:hypothetical protein
VGLKCFKEKRKEKRFILFYFIFQKKFQVPQDPCKAVGDDGYAAASMRLICFQGKEFFFKLKKSCLKNKFKIARTYAKPSLLTLRLATVPSSHGDFF